MHTCYLSYFFFRYFFSSRFIALIKFCISRRDLDFASCSIECRRSARPSRWRRDILPGLRARGHSRYARARAAPLPRPRQHCQRPRGTTVATFARFEPIKKMWVTLHFFGWLLFYLFLFFLHFFFLLFSTQPGHTLPPRACRFSGESFCVCAPGAHFIYMAHAGHVSSSPARPCHRYEKTTFIMLNYNAIIFTFFFFWPCRTGVNSAPICLARCNLFPVFFFFLFLLSTTHTRRRLDDSVCRWNSLVGRLTG